MSALNGDRPRFRADVQGLRAIAILLVVVYHSGFGLRGGFLGVDVFFVISGFVIGRLLLFEQDSTGRIALGAFYARRVRRLLPALAALLVFVAVVAVAAVSPLGDTRRTIMQVGVGAAVYLANAAMLYFQKTSYFALGETTNPLLHTWTLAVEEQFYVAFPLLLILLGRVGRRALRPNRRLVVVVIVVAAVSSFLLGALLSSAIALPGSIVPLSGRFAFFSSPTRAWEFLVGVLVAAYEPSARRRSVGTSSVVGAFGLLLIAGSGIWISSDTPTPGPSTLIPVVGTALVVIAGFGPVTFIVRILSSKLAVWIGDRSYGWYLWHWPLIVFARASFPTMPAWGLLAVGIASLIPTVLSYRYLEQPIRKGETWSGWRAIGLAAACSGLAIAALVGLAAFPRGSSAGERQAKASLTPRGIQPAGCLLVGHEDDPRTEFHCSWPVAEPRGSVVLIGDSQAGMFADALAKEATEHGYSMYVSYRPSCPFADIERVATDTTVTTNCRDYVTRSMSALAWTKPNLVVIASLEDTYVSQRGFVMKDPSSGLVARDDTSRARVWRDGLTRTLRTLTSEGMKVVVISTVPQLAPFNLGVCPAWRLWTDPSGCARTLTRAKVDANRALGSDATKAAVDAVPGAYFVDFSNDLCGPTTCSTLRGDTWLYANAAHLSAAGAGSLGPAIERDVLSRLSS